MRNTNYVTKCCTLMRTHSLYILTFFRSLCGCTLNILCYANVSPLSRHMILRNSLYALCVCVCGWIVSHIFKCDYYIGFFAIFFSQAHLQPTLPVARRRRRTHTHHIFNVHQNIFLYIENKINSLYYTAQVFFTTRLYMISHKCNKI